MSAVKVVPSNFEMFSGDSKLLIVDTLDQADAVVDITGATISMVISKRVGSSVLVTKAGTITDGVNGVFQVDLAPADTASLNGVHYFEMQMTDVSARVSTVVFGSLTIKRDAVV
jgi:hypothetical protein